MFFREIKNIFQFVIFSNLFVASCVTALFLSSEILLESKNYHLSIFVFFSTIVTYNFQRIIRIRKGIKHAREPWLKTNNKTIIFLISIGVAISIYSFLSFNCKTQIAIICCGIISVLYPFGLRMLPFLKVFIISVVWAVTTFLLLVLENNLVFDFNSVMHFLGRLFFVFAITIPFDIRDLKFDINHLKTIPVFFG